MSNKILALAFVAIITMACCAGGAVAIANNSTHSSSIAYELDGGNNSEYNPTKYDEGKTYDLRSATKEDFAFGGWFLDKELTQPCYSITSDMKGDLTLYAKWDETLTGKGFTLAINGEVRGMGFFDTYSLDGEATYKYLYYNSEKDDYFMQYISEITYKYDFVYDTQTVNNDKTYWNSDNEDPDYEWLENETISTINGEKDCEVILFTFDDGSTEKQWIGDGWIPYYIEYKSIDFMSSTIVTYTYIDDFQFTSDETCDVNAYADVGITVSGSGTYNLGQTVTLTATASDGTNFKGWYDSDGVLLSDSATYKVTVSGTDISVFALNDKDPDYTFESDKVIELDTGIDITSASWKIVNIESGKTIANLTGTVLKYTFDDAGEYYIMVEGEVDGSPYLGCYSATVTGDITRTFEWIYNGHTYTYDLDIDYSDLIYYRNYYDVSERGQSAYNNHEHDKTFVTYEDKYVVEIANHFKTLSAGMSDVQTANLILTFTQYIEYQLDDVYMGYSEYWKFPVETLYDQGGDCEDTSILYCAIAKAMGYDTAMLLFSGHMAAGISCDGCSGTNYSGYYYAETTAVGYVVGSKSSYPSALAVVVID